jgi:hypothetical protein
MRNLLYDKPNKRWFISTTSLKEFNLANDKTVTISTGNNGTVLVPKKVI